MSGSGDYISREAAESALKQPVTMSMCLTLEECKMKNAQRQIDLFVIRGLPAADVRPARRGKWNIVKLPPDPGYKAKECSACKCNFWDLEEWNFCPNCGARMEES